MLCSAAMRCWLMEREKKEGGAGWLYSGHRPEDPFCFPFYEYACLPKTRSRTCLCQLPTAKERKEEQGACRTSINVNKQRYKSSKQCLIFLSCCTLSSLLWVKGEQTNAKNSKEGKKRTCPEHDVLPYSKQGARNGISILVSLLPSLHCSQPPPSLLSLLPHFSVSWLTWWKEQVVPLFFWLATMKKSIN